MNGNHQAVVWINHNEAKVFGFSDDAELEVDFHSNTALQHLHHGAAGWEAGGNPPNYPEFYQRILRALDPVGAIVITGPDTFKDVFKAFLDHCRPVVASRVRAVEAMDEPAAEAVLAIAHRYFKADIESQPPVTV